jgi:glycerophosphoryl diester phosphodiesterase
MLLNIAHRGARSLAPENTLMAARRGYACGADLWETDLAVSADEQLILFHDNLLGRTTDVAALYPERREAPFTTFTLEELRRLDAGSWFVETDPFGQIAAGALSSAERRACRGERIPTLEEALVLTRALDWRINLELKRLPAPMANFPVVARVLATIDRVGLAREDFVISSFNHDWLREVLARRPDVHVQALVGFHTAAPLDWGALDFGTYNVRSTLTTPADVRAKVAAGFAINLFTVNEPDAMQAFAAAGADGLITDFPQRLAALGL